jgi:hypothetical protein
MIILLLLLSYHISVRSCSYSKSNPTVNFFLYHQIMWFPRKTLDDNAYQNQCDMTAHDLHFPLLDLGIKEFVDYLNAAF